MRRPHLNRPALLGPSRRARWRRIVLRRLAAIACAVGAVLLLIGVVRPPDAPMTTVLVAARDIVPGQVLDDSDLRTTRVPSEPAPVAAATRGDLVGRRTATSISAGELLTRTRVVPRGPTDGLAPGTSAVRLLLADPGTLGMLRPGDRVRLFPDTGGPSLANDVLVLGLDTPGDTGSLPDGSDGDAGLVAALPDSAVERIFAGQRPDGGPPRVLAVVSR
ncbi:Flp pilus assembly protein CpaB [Knoellia remsis]|uniref:Flp pilus assembly protein CpaB n=1 Tax=Knoellia remsis TaxID=407159 RepID=A0A2T0U6F2_9MICO|nr:SAF domain-containing protein [Knoellia remsis]PRY53487.1 Flp pilus assembly protein CpaB [Knoellia remsis]